MKGIILDAERVKAGGEDLLEIIRRDGIEVGDDDFLGRAVREYNEIIDGYRDDSFGLDISWHVDPEADILTVWTETSGGESRQYLLVPF